jgi:hypothetical protein
MFEIKYFIFFITLLVCVPIGGLLACKYKRIEYFILSICVFFTCRLNESINFISHEYYRGTSRGFEVTLVDLCTLCLLIVAFKKNGFRGMRWFPPGSFLYFLYFSFSALSVINAGERLYSYFEIFKLVRMYFLYWVIANYITSVDDLKCILRAVIGVVLYIFLVVIWDKYIGGRYQARGPFPHQNSLVMYMQVFGGIAFSLFFNSKYFRMKWLLITGISSMLVVMTLSRGGMLCYALSCMLIYILSFYNEYSFKKVLYLFYLFIGVFLFGIKSFNTIYERFTTAPKESAETRVYLAKTAVNMANDKIFGVGLNNFGLKVNKPYIYSKHSPRYHTKDFKEGLVETTYLMIAAETGWHNLVVYIMFLLSFYYRAIRLVVFYRRTLLCPVFIGVLGGLTGIYIESTLEWVLRQSTNSYQLMFVFALLSAFYVKQELKKSGLHLKEAL